DVPAALGGAARAEAAPSAATEHVLEDVLEAAAARGEAGASAATTAPGAAEHATEEVLEAGSTGGAAAARGEAGAAAGHCTDGVVLLSLLRVGEHRVGLTDLLEASLGRRVPRVAVRVEVPGELPVGLLDGCCVSVLGDAESLVEVLLDPVLAGHRASPPPRRRAVRVAACGGGAGRVHRRRPAPLVTRGWWLPP